MDDDVEVLALLAKPFVQHDGASQVLVVVVDLLAQLVDELVEAQVDLKGQKNIFEFETQDRWWLCVLPQLQFHRREIACGRLSGHSVRCRCKGPGGKERTPCKRSPLW